MAPLGHPASGISLRLDASVRRVSSPVSPAGSLARASPLLGGRKASFPQLLLILVPSDSVVGQPPSSFSSSRLVASFVSQYLRLAAALTRWPGRPSRKCPRPQNPCALDPHSRSRALPPAKDKRSRGRGSLIKLILVGITNSVPLCSTHHYS